MCDNWFDGIFQYIQSIYREAENSFNELFDEHMNEYLEQV
jgi:hypothetical protein